jgi:hypothetical protein
METKMRRRVLTVLGVLLVATLTVQTATAAARNARKSARVPVPVTQQLRERDGFSPSAAVHSRSCHRFWCYEGRGTCLCVAQMTLQTVRQSRHC